MLEQSRAEQSIENMLDCSLQRCSLITFLGSKAFEIWGPPSVNDVMEYTAHSLGGWLSLLKGLLMLVKHSDPEHIENWAKLFLCPTSSGVSE